ncbi:Hypothetical protein SMAX5B_007008 [Scophthalmus maximus]|uniref:Uncharacterized protein n=1 Tax=Scophthalmus maximus TaxID=52904 RepID=A0A2U9B9U3_SCOMX|nr:Hypothetical protein SMAX5B_007008 [Scophthalmus maximus]
MPNVSASKKVNIRLLGSWTVGKKKKLLVCETQFEQGGREERTGDESMIGEEGRDGGRGWMEGDLKASAESETSCAPRSPPRSPLSLSPHDLDDGRRQRRAHCHNPQYSRGHIRRATAGKLFHRRAAAVRHCRAPGRRPSSQ